MGQVSTSVLYIEENGYYNLLLLLLLSNPSIESHFTWSGTLDPICGGKRVNKILIWGENPVFWRIRLKDKLFIYSSRKCHVGCTLELDGGFLKYPDVLIIPRIN